MQLENTREGCAVETVTVIKSRIPFLGRIMDNFIGEMTEKSIEQEFNFISENVWKKISFTNMISNVKTIKKGAYILYIEGKADKHIK